MMQAMNEIAGRHLYHSVVTDDLQLFAAGLNDTPNLPNRVSSTKLDLLGRIKRLYLEDRLWEVVGKDWKEVDFVQPGAMDDTGRGRTVILFSVP